MRILNLATMIFCHILLTSFILYSSLTSASPLAEQPNRPSNVEPPKNVDVAIVAEDPQQVQVQQPPQPVQYAAGNPVAVPKVEQQAEQQPLSQKTEQPIAQEKDSLVQKSSVKSVEIPVETPKSQVEAAEKQQPPKYVDQQQLVPKENKDVQATVVAAKQEQSPVAPFEQDRPELKVVPQKQVVVEPAQPKVYESPKPVAQEQAVIPSLDASIQEKLVAVQPIVVETAAAAVPAAVIEQQQQQQQAPAPATVVEVKESSKTVDSAPVEIYKQVAAASAEPVAAKLVVSTPPPVKGGLGPLHLLAATLCSYQPNKPVSDETLTYLYNQRAAQRKSLFQFMSLKFTNLDKLTAHLNAGLEVAKTVDSSESSLVRSHGWPVVGNCTSHYLKLMAEAAWCDCAEEPHCLRDLQDARQQPSQPQVQLQLLAQPRLARRSADQQVSEQLSSNAERTSSVMSKLMYVGDVREAPVVESSQKTVAQPATVASTRQCRRNALRLAKALFNHLAENQTEISESWPKLHAELAQDECARKRMIDIVAALSTFRGESTQVHRDNIEFAFAMDDLRGKVLENEVNTPLTFDKQVIEVEQFLQQSVRLMLANIDPKRAKLTSMRYRSLHAPVSADDQCIELHQRLLNKNYPDECNPNQYGPLPDVLRMAALSLDLWSIEQDLSKHSAAAATSLQQAAPRQEDVNECIANLVAN